MATRIQAFQLNVWKSHTTGCCHRNTQYGRSGHHPDQKVTSWRTGGQGHCCVYSNKKKSNSHSQPGIVTAARKGRQLCLPHHVKAFKEVALMTNHFQLNLGYTSKYGAEMRFHQVTCAAMRCEEHCPQMLSHSCNVLRINMASVVLSSSCQFWSLPGLGGCLWRACCSNTESK